jgi:hypothetical protein
LNGKKKKKKKKKKKREKKGRHRDLKPPERKRERERGRERLIRQSDGLTKFTAFGSELQFFAASHNKNVGMKYTHPSHVFQ